VPSQTKDTNVKERAPDLSRTGDGHILADDDGLAREPLRTVRPLERPHLLVDGDSPPSTHAGGAPHPACAGAA